MSFTGPFMTINISKALRKEREQRGLTITQAAEKSGLSEEVYSRIEAGKKSLTTKEVVSVSSFLNVKPEVLIGEPEQESSIKFRSNNPNESKTTTFTIEKAKQIFKEMIAQDMLRDHQ